MGPHGEPIDNARLTLKNTVYSEVGQAVSDMAGYYHFNSVGDGVYYIEVDPVGTLYERQTRRLDIVSIRPGGSADVYQMDFQLHSLQPIEKPLPKKLAESLLFVQEIPPTARERYKAAQKLLEKEKKEEAYAALRESIEIFPDYYDALDLLGSEYLKAGFSNVAVPLFLQAVDVNKKGWHAYQGLGAAYGNLKMRKEAIAALERSAELNPVNARTFFALGGEYSKDPAKIADAVKAFQQAVKLDAEIVPEAYIGLAGALSSLGRYGEAADALASYMKAAPDIKNKEAIDKKIRDLRKKAQSAPASPPS